MRFASRRGRFAIELVLDLRVKPRHLAEERVVVIGEAVRDFVDDLQAGMPEQVRAPQQQHRAAQLLLVAPQLRVVADEAFALVDQVGDFELARQSALAPHFGRMRGQHRADQRAVEEFPEGLRRNAGFARALERVSERAGPRRRTLDHMRAIAADVVLILGDVGQMRKVGERAHDRERLVVVEAVEDRRELAPRAGLVVAMEADRGLADALDKLEGLVALLLAHRVAEHAPEQADVFAQRRVLLLLARIGSRRAGAERRRSSSELSRRRSDGP